MPELHVLTGDGREETIALGDRSVTFGRSDECDVLLSETRASRRHCTFLPESGGWRVVDEGSSNGTFLGGKPVLSVRLKPGDELEIGQTVITYVADAVQPTRTRRVAPARRPAWGLLTIPVVFALAGFLGLGAYDSVSAAEREQTWYVAAQRVIERANVPVEAERRESHLREFAASIPESAERARRAIEAAQRDSRAPVTDRSAWSGDLSDLRGNWDLLAPVERRSRLRQLLERHVEDAAAVAEIRELIERLAREDDERGERDRVRTSREAGRAQDEGRLGDALDLWMGWALRAPNRGREMEQSVAAAMQGISESARAAAEKAVDDVKMLSSAGRPDSALERATSALDDLHGTGWDAWLRARVRDVLGHGGASAVAITSGSGGDAESARAQASAMHALASAEDLARARQFEAAARRLEQALAGVTDATLRTDLELRLADLRAESSVIRRTMALVREAPRKFSPVVLEDGNWSVNGATDDGLMLGRESESAVRTFAELPAEAIALTFRRADLTPENGRAAALLLWDVGARDVYVAHMRALLANEDDVERNIASALHARLNGKRTPDGGYVPHPDDGTSIISWNDYQALVNAAKIVEFSERLEKLVVKVETSKQAKDIARVAEAFARLEAARDYALELIFDEVRYFYPYRDRMAEYVPVQNEVDERVAAVREAWAEGTRARLRKDRSLEKLLDEAEELRIEIDYLGGDSSGFGGRIDAVARYLDRDLTVQNWFVTESDLELLEYNDRVMQSNAAMDTVATDPEREQVRITNEYRRMFGHRTALRIHDRLIDAARGHSKDMARLGFFDHFSPVPGKRSPGDRMQLAGYPLSGGSENIHMGSGTAQGAHDSWIHSSGHHRNILMPAWREMGTGHAGRHWTQNFGFRDTDYTD